MSKEKSKSKEKSSESFLYKRIKYMLFASLLSSGVGYGGYQLKDYPIIAQILSLVSGDSKLGDGNLAQALVAGLGNAEKKLKEFSQEGAFDVTLKEISIDPAVVSNENSPELRAVIVRYDDSGERQVVWQSKNATIQRPDGDKGALLAQFEDPPFEIRWRPGDRLVVEVWQKRLLRGVKLFERADASAEKFPLSPGDYPLKLVASGVKSTSPALNSLALEAKRKVDDGKEEPRRVARKD